MTDTPAIAVSDNPQAKRFEAHADGELLGYVAYIPLAGKIIATHTEVDEQHEGKGVGSALVGQMVEQLRADGRRLQPKCSYVKAWLRRHPDQTDVIDPTTPH